MTCTHREASEKQHQHLSCSAYSRCLLRQKRNPKGVNFWPRDRLKIRSKKCHQLHRIYPSGTLFARSANAKIEPSCHSSHQPDFRVTLVSSSAAATIVATCQIGGYIVEEWRGVGDTISWRMIGTSGSSARMDHPHQGAAGGILIQALIIRVTGS